MANALAKQIDAPPDEGTSESAEGAANRRVHRRHQIEIEIDVTSDHNFYAGISFDLSEGGVFVATHLNRPIGTVIDLALRLPGCDTPLHCVGEVRWVRAYREDSESPPGLGVRFVLLEPGAREAIQAFLAERDPMFYE